MAEERPAVSNSSPTPKSEIPAAAAPAADAAAPAEFTPAPAAAESSSATATAEMDEASIEELLKQASFEEPAASAAAAVDVKTESLELPNFKQVIQDAQISSIDLLRDVDMNVKIELGRAKMLVEDVLKLGEGSVVELDKLAGDPVDVFVNDRLVARGEVLVLNDNFCVRINEIVAGVKEEGL